MNVLTNVATLRASALELAGRIDRRASRRHGIARMGVVAVVNECFHNIIYQATHVHRQRRAKELECRCHDGHGSPCVGVCVVVALRAHRQTEAVGKFIAERRHTRHFASAPFHPPNGIAGRSNTARMRSRSMHR